MDIIFKFGQHYYENQDSSILVQILITFVGALFGFGFALWLYYFQTKKDYKKEQLKLVNENYDRLKYFNLLIDNVIHNFNQFKEIVKEYITEQEENYSVLKGLSKIASNNYNRIHSIDNKGIFEAFNRLYQSLGDKDWISSFNKIFTSIDHLEKNTNSIYQVYEITMHDLYPKLTEAKDNMEKVTLRFSILANEITKKLGDKKSENRVYNFLNDSLLKYDRLVKSRADLNEIKKSYIDVVLNELYTNYLNEFFTTEILIYCKNSRVLMKEVELGLKDFISNLNNLDIETNESLEYLIQIHEKLKNVP